MTERDVRGVTGTWLKTKSFLTLPLVMAKSDPPKDYVLEKGECRRLPPARARCAATPFPVWHQQGRLQRRRRQGVAAGHAGPAHRPRICLGALRVSLGGAPGKHVLMTRATDKKGEAQPDTLPFNELGINCNVIPRFQVEVL